MIGFLEEYIRHNWQSLNPFFPQPERISFVLFKGFRKVIYYVFSNNDPMPFGILKVSNEAVVFDRLSREFETLSHLFAKGSISGNIPRPLAFFEMQKHVCSFQSALKGSPMVYRLKGIRNRSGLARMKEIFNDVVELLIRLHKIEIPGGTGGGAHEGSEHSPAPVVIEQGDFNISNLLVPKSGINICDWEYSKMGGVPLSDLLEFSLSYVFFARFLANEIKRERLALDDFEEAFLKKSPHTEVVWEHIRWYNDAIGVDRSSIPDIFSRFASKHLTGEDYRVFREKLKNFLNKQDIIE